MIIAVMIYWIFNCSSVLRKNVCSLYDAFQEAGDIRYTWHLCKILQLCEQAWEKKAKIIGYSLMN